MFPCASLVPIEGSLKRVYTSSCCRSLPYDICWCALSFAYCRGVVCVSGTLVSAGGCGWEIDFGEDTGMSVEMYGVLAIVVI
jgi:hypothetical protein